MSSITTSLLGEDGRGFDLARKLESHGVWRTWLGDSAYSSFVHFLSSPSSWDTFMRADDSKSKAQIQLQLRARALLFDKATVSLFHRSNNNNTASKLNPAYLQLHADDVYYTLEGGNGIPDVPNVTSSKCQPKSSYGFNSRFGESETDNLPQRFRNEELPETWYNQFIEKYKLTRPYRLSFGDKELDKRTPEGMSTYIRLHDNLKRKRIAFIDDHSILDGTDLIDDGIPIFPETMFTMNSVPDNPLSTIVRDHTKPKKEFYGVLDSLPLPSNTRNPVMLERLGIRPEVLSIDRGTGLRGKTGSDGIKKRLAKEQASQISQKVVARILANVGFEGVTEVPLEIFSQLLGCHISKLGRNLKVLTDGYRKQCSAIELIKMFLQTAGYSNVGVLAELVKDGTRTTVQQTQQQPIHVGYPPILDTQLGSGMGSKSFDQLSESSGYCITCGYLKKAGTNRVTSISKFVFDLSSFVGIHLEVANLSENIVLVSDKVRPLVQVKLEAPSEMPMDANTFNNPINARYAQMQFRQQQQQQQQQQPMANFHTQNNNQFRQLASLQVPQMHSPTMSMARSPPVKVEGFSELMGGGSSSKLDSEENKMTSPLSK
ncbi:hypothetical protein ACFE04_018764 [Oxalis oulophora]